MRVLHILKLFHNYLCFEFETVKTLLEYTFDIKNLILNDYS